MGEKVEPNTFALALTSSSFLAFKWLINEFEKGKKDDVGNVVGKKIERIISMQYAKYYLCDSLMKSPKKDEQPAWFLYSFRVITQNTEERLD